MIIDRYKKTGEIFRLTFVCKIINIEYEEVNGDRYFHVIFIEGAYLKKSIDSYVLRARDNKGTKLRPFEGKRIIGAWECETGAIITDVWSWLTKKAVGVENSEIGMDEDQCNEKEELFDNVVNVLKPVLEDRHSYTSKSLINVDSDTSVTVIKQRGSAGKLSILLWISAAIIFLIVICKNL